MFFYAILDIVSEKNGEICLGRARFSRFFANFVFDCVFKLDEKNILIFAQLKAREYKITKQICLKFYELTKSKHENMHPPCKGL